MPVDAPAGPEPALREPASLLADELIDRAQGGGPAEALAAADRALAAGAAHPALHFARAVALDCLADHSGSCRAADEGVRVAVECGRDGWRAASLAMRAIQLLHLADEDPAAYDEDRVLRDLAEAQVALTRDVADPAERVAARTNLATAYGQLRLYELALPQYLASYTADRDEGLVPPEAAAVQQLNICMLHLTWAAELSGVDRPQEARQHLREAGVHAAAAERAAAGEHRTLWVHRSRVFTGCAWAESPRPQLAVELTEIALAGLGDAGAYERAFCAPFLARALARCGRREAALACIETAIAALRPDTDPQVAAATRRVHLVLLAETDAGARTGLAYGDTLAAVLWRQRARRLSAAEALVRYERLRVEHEMVSRDSDVDALTGAATRRAYDRRAAALETRRRAANAPVCVLVVDLDRFKQVNDRFGHQAGDTVLRSVGRALSAAVRGEDMVARFGGDEFVALLSFEARSGRAVAERMLAAVRSAGERSGGGLRATVSIGIAVTSGGRDFAGTLAAADRAMYAAKRAGGDLALTEAEMLEPVRTGPGARWTDRAGPEPVPEQ